MRVLSVLFAPAIFTDLNLFFVHLCKMVNLSCSMEHRRGAVGTSVSGCSRTVFTLRGGYHLGKLACDLVEKHGFRAYKAKTYFANGARRALDQPIATALNIFSHLPGRYRNGIDRRCLSRNHEITDRILRGDPLEELWRESNVPRFVRKSGFRDVRGRHRQPTTSS